MDASVWTPVCVLRCACLCVEVSLWRSRWGGLHNDKVTHDRGSLFPVAECLAGRAWVIFRGSLVGHYGLFMAWVTLVWWPQTQMVLVYKYGYKA